MTNKKTIEKEDVNNTSFKDNEEEKIADSRGKEKVNNQSDNTSGKDDNMSQTKAEKTTKSKQTSHKQVSKEKKALKETEKKNKELHDKYLRLSAEFDNYRKRTLNEKMNLTKYASEEILKDLLPVIDDFQRALLNIDEAKDLDALKKGMELINIKFKSFLNQKGLKEIEAMHKDFNMDFHEAVTKIPAPSKDLKGKIVDVIEKGYMLNDKVVRYSKVVIGE
ncbi:nucleotide exchange factor GrpE [Bacteroidota bacterium]